MIKIIHRFTSDIDRLMKLGLKMADKLAATKSPLALGR